MAYVGQKVFYRGHLQGVKEITFLHEYLLVKFDNGKVIAYDLGTPKIIFEEDKHGKRK